jgi:hypothetical protein
LPARYSVDPSAEIVVPLTTKVRFGHDPRSDETGPSTSTAFGGEGLGDGGGAGPGGGGGLGGGDGTGLGDGTGEGPGESNACCVTVIVWSAMVTNP